MQELKCLNKVDENNNPTGGSVDGIGLKINWQEGPLGTGTKRIPPNGAFVEGIIQAALQRLEFFQATKFNCLENSMAIISLLNALKALNVRTELRKSRGVEGTHNK